MHSKTFFTVFALATAVISAPLPGSSDIGGALESISDLVGSPFGNGNSDGSSNTAGSGNSKNGNGNGIGDGDGNGDSNVFGNGNAIGSGDTGFSIGRRGDESLGDVIEGLVGSPFGNGNGDGDGNSAGNGNVGNGDGNGQDDGNGNGDGNVFGNGNSIGSGDTGFSIGRKVRRDLPADAGALIPEQTVDELDEDFSGLITVLPGSIEKAAKGAVTGVDNQKREQLNKKQVLTGLEDIIAQGIAADLP